MQIDLRNESVVQFIAPSPYPIITFGPFASPTAVLVSLSHAIGNLLHQFGLSLSHSVIALKPEFFSLKISGN